MCENTEKVIRSHTFMQFVSMYCVLYYLPDVTVYSYFMPVQGTVKTIDPRCWRWLENCDCVLYYLADVTVYSYFMPVQATVKTIDPRCWRWLENCHYVLCIILSDWCNSAYCQDVMKVLKSWMTFNTIAKKEKRTKHNNGRQNNAKRSKD
jgi:hypothetical protein